MYSTVKLTRNVNKRIHVKKMHLRFQSHGKPQTVEQEQNQQAKSTESKSVHQFSSIICFGLDFGCGFHLLQTHTNEDHPQTVEPVLCPVCFGLLSLFFAVSGGKCLMGSFEQCLTVCVASVDFVVFAVLGSFQEVPRLW